MEDQEIVEIGYGSSLSQKDHTDFTKLFLSSTHVLPSLLDMQRIGKTATQEMQSSCGVNSPPLSSQELSNNVLEDSLSIDLHQGNKSLQYESFYWKRTVTVEILDVGESMSINDEPNLNLFPTGLKLLIDGWLILSVASWKELTTVKPKQKPFAFSCLFCQDLTEDSWDSSEELAFTKAKKKYGYALGRKFTSLLNSEELREFIHSKLTEKVMSGGELRKRPGGLEKEELRYGEPDFMKDVSDEDKKRITNYLFKADTIPKDFEFAVHSLFRCGFKKGRGLDWNEQERKIIDCIKDLCRIVALYDHAAVLMQFKASLEALFEALSMVISERNIIKLDSQEGVYWPITN